jgi:hypothetical protein
MRNHTRACARSRARKVERNVARAFTNSSDDRAQIINDARVGVGGRDGH